MFYKFQTGPSSPPTNFRIMATSSDSISVSWNPPPEGEQNGVITGYTFTCQPEELLDRNFPIFYSTHGTHNLDGFRPATSYNCSIFAMTAGGSGPSVLQEVSLLDGGETF